MQLSQVSKLSTMERFAYWVMERHSIFLKRKDGLPKPWTDDEVLQKFFFTNPFRENDKVTQWFREKIRKPLADHKDVLFATIAFRWFNYIPTGEQLLMAPWNKTDKFGAFTAWKTPEIVGRLSSLAEHDAKIFTGAFNISNSGSTKPKINRVCEDYIQPVWEDRFDLIERAESWESLQEAHKDIVRYPGLGGSGFMAYEVISDLRYTWALKTASDILTWANPGPGAKRGLNRLQGNPLEASLRKDDYNDTANEVREELRRLLIKNGVYDTMPTIDARVIEHSLCEFDKYERARLGDGHMKRTYPGK